MFCQAKGVGSVKALSNYAEQLAKVLCVPQGHPVSAPTGLLTCDTSAAANLAINTGNAAAHLVVASVGTAATKATASVTTGVKRVPSAQAARTRPSRRVDSVLWVVLLAAQLVSAETYRCPENSTSNYEMTGCECQRGFEAIEEQQDGQSMESKTSWCVGCSAGYYKNVSGSSRCSPCEAGKFSHSVSSTSCTACEAGKSSSQSAASSSAACSLCGVGKFSGNGSLSCSKCNAPFGHVCGQGSATSAGVKCGVHLFCRGGESGAIPLTVVVVGAMGFLVSVAMLLVMARGADQKCYGKACKLTKDHKLDCRRPKTRIIKSRIASFVVLWALNAAFAGQALFEPEVSAEGWHGMLALTVLASIFAVLSPFVLPLVLRKWMHRSVCCLCQISGDRNQVAAIPDIDSKVEDICYHCIGRYHQTNRKPEGAIVYDHEALRDFIEGIATEELHYASSELIEGLPEMSFKATNLPEGLTVDPKTGAIQGTPESPYEGEVEICAYNADGECSSKVMIRVRAQVPPSGLNYKDAIPAASEWGDAGLLLTGEDVSMEPSVENVGLPPGTYFVDPPLPEGLNLDPENGKIHGTPSSVKARANYKVTLKNEAGSVSSTFSLEVQEHSTVSIQYPPELTRIGKVHTIMTIEKEIVPITPIPTGNSTNPAENLNLKFDVNPDLPDGLKLDEKTGEITGTPMASICKTCFTVTVRNRKGFARATVEFAVAAHWSGIRLRDWTADQTLMWLSEVCEFTEDILVLFKDVDGKSLEGLDTEDKMRSKHPDWPPYLQILVPIFVKNRQQQQAKKEEEEAQKAAKEAIGGLDALMQSLELDEQTSFIAARFCKTNGVEHVEHLARSDFAERLARELGVSEVMAVKLIQAIKGDDVALTAPAGLSYASVMTSASEFANPPQSTGLMQIGDPVSMLPSFEHAGSPFASFSVDALPAGLTLNVQTGEIHGTPSSVTARRDYTVTMANLVGKTDFILSLEVAGWEQLPPEMWNVKMCQAWLMEELEEMEEGDRAQFVNVDGTQLVTLQSKADVASKFPSLKPGVQKMLALSVSRLVDGREQKKTTDDPKGSGEALEALISNIRVAASELGLDVERSPDLLKDKFDASKLVMGLPPDAGRGISPFLNYEGGEQALLAQAARGLDAIMEELDKHGTAEAKENAKYVLEMAAGSSPSTFQEGCKRDCDPVTGEVLESRMVADPSAPGGKRPMRFKDFCKHEIAQFCRLTKAEVFALRFYTTAGFKVINWPLRDEGRRARQEPHKLAVLVFILAGAIKKLRAWAATSAQKNIPLSLFRGMSVREIFDTFMEDGGTELAPMSATAELKIALLFSQGRQGTISTLLWIRTENFMDRGVDLEWLSAFPHEKEYLYPPLSFLKPIQTEPTVLKIGSCLYQVVELRISMS